MTCGDLFAGIGGMSLGLERAGIAVCWQVEIDAFPRSILTKHWPDIPQFEDVRDCGAQNLTPVDLIAGGFPCQDISVAGHGRGLTGKRSILWLEYARIVDELRPTWVLIENVAHGWGRWVPSVRCDLWDIGYASLPLWVSAAALGADHQRARIFVLAHSNGERLWDLSWRWQWPCRTVATEPLDSRWGTPTSRVARSHDGIPNALERCRALGNAVIPQVVEMIGCAIMELALTDAEGRATKRGEDLCQDQSLL